MSSELERIAKWRNGFTDFLLKDNSDLIALYSGRIMFFPNEDNPGELRPALNELDERYATLDQLKRMRDVLMEYCAEHPV